LEVVCIEFYLSKKKCIIKKVKKADIANILINVITLSLEADSKFTLAYLHI